MDEKEYTSDINKKEKNIDDFEIQMKLDLMSNFFMNSYQYLENSDIIIIS